MMGRIARVVGYCACIGTFSLALGAQIWVWREDANYRLNSTPSMPVGLWAISRHLPAPQQLQRGETVSVCLPRSVAIPARQRGYVGGGECPGNTTPILKTIAAIPGDVVTICAGGMMVNGYTLPHSRPLIRDHKGRPLIAVPPGSYVVPTRDIWVYAGHDGRSFDSRYYGAIPTQNVIGRAWPLLVMR